MANVNRPRGARAVRMTNGSENIPQNSYSVDASNETAIFLGDFITMETDGNVKPAAAGGRLLGVCVGVDGDLDNLGRRHLPATTAGTIFVADSPDTMFELQEDDGGTALTSAERFALVDIVAGAGSATTSISAHELDQDSVDTTSGQLRLHGLAGEDPNNAYGDNADWLVTINEHEFSAATGI